jgi:hypothetical protein
LDEQAYDSLHQILFHSNGQYRPHKLAPPEVGAAAEDMTVLSVQNYEQTHSAHGPCSLSTWSWRVLSHERSCDKTPLLAEVSSDVS